MAKVVLILLPVLFIMAVIASLRACHSSADHAENRQAGPAALIALDDNSVLLATDGTITQEIVDWLKSPGPDHRRFEVGGHLFAPGSAAPLASADNRAVRLVQMLRAYPGVNARVIGETRSSGEPQRDLLLSERRAKASVDLLVRFGVDRKRLTAVGEGASHPRYTPDSPNAALNDRLVLELEKSR